MDCDDKPSVGSLNNVPIIDQGRPLKICHQAMPAYVMSDEQDFTFDTARTILKNAPGVVVIDDRASNRFPTPLAVSNKDEVAVGRIRQDEEFVGLKKDGINGMVFH
ncbi:hypothetical protein RJ639_002133 [Escallonia herrerae]|uniref:Semialdehyde dehydrogenase dimerisation domain-containing protein n=1 Tax=Escallonia herrerae TaxID=1293975 RepID=A0AA88XBY8_9ASTE|nr:hypothetical protein RJ639_002133 [Escallonia herrerae]